SCITFDHGIVCELGTIRARSNATIRLSAYPPMADMLYTNRSVVVRAEPDADLANNQTQIVIATAPPSLAVRADSITEGNAGVHGLPIQVTLSAPSRLPVIADFQTRSGTARSPSDFPLMLGVVSI